MAKPAFKGHKGQKQNQKKSSRADKRAEQLKVLKDLSNSVNDFELNDDITEFEQLPLSKQTLSGLRKSNYVTMTDIQRKAIELGLKGKDILGAARTGSGKTLAFLIPVLEVLFHKQWNHEDGLGALVIAPTRELAVQIFEVLRKIGRFHTFSAGLVIGGKDVSEERDRLAGLNILIATPGRILQHMDQTVGFDSSALQILVLDEADRIMDMGFKSTVDAIVEHLPRERQTMLFSATQTKYISDLARLSLNHPEYIAVHEQQASSTPIGLTQNYVIVPDEEKLNVLFGFIRTHLQSKVLVFFSSGKQVRFVYETFRKLRPGIPLLHLQGKQKQTARMDVTKRFSDSQHACLFATDIVARGLDFPAVDWVIQVDCPEDADTYIHRVGRTARYGKEGRALLFLTPSQAEPMVERLEKKRVPITKITVKDSKRADVTKQLQGLCFSDPEIKYLGQKAFISYVRSLYLQKDKQIFQFDKFDGEKFAASLGLPGAPKIKLLGGASLKEKKNASRQLAKELKESESEGDKEDGDNKKDKVRTRYDRMFERRNQNVLSEHYANMIDGVRSPDSDKHDGEADQDDEFLKIKRQDHKLEEEGTGTSEDVDNLPQSKRQAKLAISKKALLKQKGLPTKLVFDDEGKPHKLYEFEDLESFNKAGEASEQVKQFLNEQTERMKEVDVDDKALVREKRMEKKRKQQETQKRQMAELADEESASYSEKRRFAEQSKDEAAKLLAELDQVNQGQGEQEDTSASEVEGPPSKKARKWFQQEEQQDDGVIRVEQPETLDDLEALSSMLLKK